MLAGFIFLALVAAYALLSVFFVISLKSSRQDGAVMEPVVSVVIAAKNEAENIFACLDSIAGLDYPPEKLEVIVVDDDSTDNTAEIIRRSLVPKFKLGTKKSPLQITSVFLKQQDKQKPGKAGALLAGVEKSRGEFIFVTDADCLVAPTWIKSILKNFGPDVGVSGGPTVVENSSPWAQPQRLELLFLQAIAWVMAKKNRPVSWLGNNFSFRRSAYNEVGGFAGIKNTLVEDYALINAIRRNTDWRVKFSFNRQAMVHTKPLGNVKALYRQRKRWASDRRNIPVESLAIMVLNYAVYFLLLISIILAPIKMVLAGILLLAASNLVLLETAAGRLTVQFTFRDFIGFEGIYILTTCLFPLFFLFDKKIVWKD